MGFLDRLRRQPQGPQVPQEPRDVKFSVVVAVYNTGRYLEPCLDSLLAQTMPASQLEVILVDDGSNDGVTPQRLDEFAAEHPHVTAIHIRNSGWPGKPRNVGTDKATGEYVYYLDHDDSLAPEALERMYAMASRNRADVIIGKIAGHGRRVPTTLFRENHESCTVGTAPLMESMTPHKGFRREFLREHGIRFPEGRRRLEDHVFVVEAYLRARVVSVLSDYTCYHHIARDDAGNAGFRAIEPVGYYRNLREAVEIAERLTEPGPRRDIVLRRWYSVEMLRRVTGKVFARMKDADRRAMYREVRRLALEHFPDESIWAPLPVPERVASALLRADRFDDMVAVAELAAAQQMDLRVERWEWDAGRLSFSAVVGSRSPEGRSVVTVVDGSPVYAAWLADVPDGARVRRADPTAVLELRRRGGGTRLRLPLALAPAPTTPGEAVSYRVEGTVDPMDVTGTVLSRGVWDLFVRLRDPDTGPELVRRVGAEHGTVTAPPPPAAVVGSTPVVPYVTEKGNLSIDVGQKLKKIAAAVQPGPTPPATTTPDGDGGVAVTLDVPLHLPTVVEPGPWRLVGTRPGGEEVAVAASARPGSRPDRAVLQGTLPEDAAGSVALAWDAEAARSDRTSSPPA